MITLWLMETTRVQSRKTCDWWHINPMVVAIEYPTSIISPNRWTASRLDLWWAVFGSLATTSHFYLLLLHILSCPGHDSLSHLHQCLRSSHYSLSGEPWLACSWPTSPPPLLQLPPTCSAQSRRPRFSCASQSSWWEGQWSRWSSALRGRRGCCSHSGCRPASWPPCPEWSRQCVTESLLRLSAVI